MVLGVRVRVYGLVFWGLGLGLWVFCALSIRQQIAVV